MIERQTDKADRRRALFQLTAKGKNVDRERRGTVEAAIRRALGRADSATIRATTSLLDLVTQELGRGA